VCRLRGSVEKKSEWLLLQAHMRLSSPRPDAAKAARLEKWRRVLGAVCVLYVAVLLLVKAPASLVALKFVWHSYLHVLRQRYALHACQSVVH